VLFLKSIKPGNNPSKILLTFMKMFVLLSALICLFACNADHPKIISEKAELFFSTAEGGSLKVKARLTLKTAGEKISLHMNPKVEDLTISQGGQTLNFKQKNTLLLVSLGSSNADGVTDVDLSYTIPYKQTRNFYMDSSQIYLFNESGYLPLQGLFAGPDTVQFDITLNKELTYPQAGSSHFLYKGVTRPDMIFGDYERIPENQNGKSFVFFVPRNVKPSTDAYNLIKKTVFSADSLFAKLLQPLNGVSNIYFLNRTGGHSLSTSDLVLDESFIKMHSRKSAQAIVAHEIAHAWWGHTVHSSELALHENLADYYASVYLSTLSDRQPLTDFYAQKSMGIENEGYSSVDITEVRPEMGYRYKSAAYRVGPKLLYQLEKESGRTYLTARLKALFLSAKGKKPVSYRDLNEALESDTQAYQEFLFYQRGKGPYPNYYIKDVADGSITIFSSDQKFKKYIPLEIQFKNGTVMSDSVLLQKDNAWQAEKTYALEVEDVKIDPSNMLLQSHVSDDTWKREPGRLFMKNDTGVDPAYYKFARKFLDFLIVSDSLVAVEELTTSDEVKKTLLAASAAIRKAHPSLVGFEVYLTDETNVRVLVLFTVNEKSMKGFADMVLGTEKDVLKITQLDRFNF
jgi:hypothetical protein